MVGWWWGGVVSKGRLSRGLKVAGEGPSPFHPPPLLSIDRCPSFTSVMNRQQLSNMCRRGAGGIFLSTLLPICPEQTTLLCQCKHHHLAASETQHWCEMLAFSWRSRWRSRWRWDSPHACSLPLLPSLGESQRSARSARA